MAIEKKSLQPGVARPRQLALSRWENEGGAILEPADAGVARQCSDERGAINHALVLTLNRNRTHA